jgi:hypothetical protein
MNIHASRIGIDTHNKWLCMRSIDVDRDTLIHVRQTLVIGIWMEAYFSAIAKAHGGTGKLGRA